ncbi:hypothetical protein C2845_PM09G17360 [Panicum miliaceum]|uniref:Uncharacterized protein n=1 Tax=Panicum miliaceum TaxID=4540 RepID=A0A3L6RZX4_PANMI|nr:hypothetical protein C2845_PM09G17360 [Panicum miliaceum]
MVCATCSRSYALDSTGVEARRRQGRALVPASPPAGAIVVAPVVEHHSTKQRRDQEGRFVVAGTSNTRPWRRRTTTMNRHRVQAEEEAVVLRVVPKHEEDKYGVVGIPDVPPGFAPHDRHAQPPVVQIAEHDHVFVLNDKITVHCSFSHDSNEETGEWPKPSKRGLKRKAENIRVLLKRKFFEPPASSSSS